MELVLVVVVVVVVALFFYIHTYGTLVLLLLLLPSSSSLHPVSIRSIRSDPSSSFFRHVFCADYLLNYNLYIL